jgi:membrane protease YdiL (CAAX protease family)
MFFEALVLLAAATPPPLQDLHLPLTRLTEVTVFDALLSYPPIKALLPIPVLAALAPLVIWFFRKTWQQLDAEARADWSHRDRGTNLEIATPRPGPRSGRWMYRNRSSMVAGRSSSSNPRLVRLPRPLRVQPGSAPATAPPTPPRYDFRPAMCLVIVAVVLTLQEYYGGRRFYQEMIYPVLVRWEADGWKALELQKFSELYSYAWWSFSRVLGYVIIPFPLWKLLFPKDNLLDMGLRVSGFFQHAWIYLLCLAFVLPAMALVASQPDFGTYYPFYKFSSRSWMDFMAWELMYWVQFLSLEMFFRGWMLGALRKSVGAAAIFVMAVPYCMIHYGKPYLEANGAIVAGIVLGSLAMHTRSIYAGFLVHITVAFLMDFLALFKRGALPTDLWPS